MELNNLHALLLKRFSSQIKGQGHSKVKCAYLAEGLLHARRRPHQLKAVRPLCVWRWWPTDRPCVLFKHRSGETSV